MESQNITRYGNAAKQVEVALCCPVNYDEALLKAIPKEVIEKDYGCGDPSQYVSEGDVVIDLGSGTGKICFICSQVVGEKGRVIGVDCNDLMLEVARRNAPVVAENVGYANVEFVKGTIDDMKVDLSAIDAYLKENPVTSSEELFAFNEFVSSLKSTPLIRDKSVDVIVSNCVLNLVDQDKKGNLFKEMFRVLKEGGRCVISDIVSDEYVPLSMQQDSYLWTGCISGAYQESEFIKAFKDAGFVGMEILKYDAQPWQVVEGIEFRSVTIRAYKPSSELCYDGLQAVIYKGPFASVSDDSGHTFYRGERNAVCLKSFDMLNLEGYKEHFYSIQPPNPNPLSTTIFDCNTQFRDPKDTKNGTVTSNTSTSCCGDTCC